MCIFNGVIFISEQENTALTVMLAAISNEAAVWKKALVTEKTLQGSQNGHFLKWISSMVLKIMPPIIA